MSDQYTPPKLTKLIVGNDGFLYADGMRLPVRYIPERKTLQFVDKDRRTASVRGTRYLEVPVGDVVNLGQEGSER